MGRSGAQVSAVLLTLAVQLTVARNYEVIFERIEGYEANPEFIGPESFIRIRRMEKTASPGLYHTIVVPKPLPNSTQVEVTIYEMRDNKLVPSWLKYTSNFCEYVAHEKRPIFDELARLYKFTPCPISGVFKIENWKPDDRMLPPVLPGPEHMMFGIRMFSGNTNVIKYGVVFVVDRFKGVRGGRGRGGGASSALISDGDLMAA